MAVTLNNNSTGNWNTAATWSTIDATSFLNSEASTQTTSNAFTSTSAFTPGAITIDALGIKLNARNAGAGTLSLRLAIAGVAVVGSTVTINMSDIPSASVAGWVTLKLATPILLLAATAYTLQHQTSINGSVSYFRDATAGNCSRVLRISGAAGAAPTTGDTVFITGDYSSAGTNNNYTVTMDNTTANSVNYANIEVSDRGTLTSGVVASTSYYFGTSGNLIIDGGGTVNLGTTGSPMPASSTLDVLFNAGTNVSIGIITRGTSPIFKTFGDHRANMRVKLAADAAASATALTLDTNIGTTWKNGDTIAIASTTATGSQCESVVLGADSSGTSIPTVGALANAHSGSSPTQAEVINLTRNISIHGASVTLQTYANFSSTCTVSCNDTEFKWMGSATATTRGIDLLTTTGSATFVGCSFHNFEVASSISLNLSGTAANVTISDCVMFKIAGAAIFTGATISTAITMDSIVALMNTTASNSLMTIACTAGSFTNITAVGGTLGNISFSCTTSTPSSFTINNIISHSSGSTGISILITNDSSTYLMVSNLTSWRNTTRGINVGSNNIIVDTGVAFGNAFSGYALNNCSNVITRSIVCNAGITVLQPNGFELNTESAACFFDLCSSGVTQTHSNGDVQIFLARQWHDATFRNCTMSSSTLMVTSTNLSPSAGVKFQRINGTLGNHKFYKKFGIMTRDTVIFNANTQSIRLTPNSATNKLIYNLHKIAMKTGQSAYVYCYVRKSVAGDGTAYNGNQPRLILLADSAAGILSDTVLATAAGAAGSWELLTGSLPVIPDNMAYTIAIDCDGTTGWVNFADFRVN